MTVKLFPIEVRGQGTAEIESLPSYIHRLAYRHGVYVGELVRFADRQINRDPTYEGEQHILPRYIQNQDILRTNQLTEYIVCMFEHLTSQSLSGTFASFISVSFNRSSQELLKGFRWCPECIGDMLRQEEEPYFKLIWQFQAIKSCAIHRTSFLQHCAECGCDQTTYKKRRHLGACQECGMSLSFRKVNIELNELTSSWEDTGQDVIDLVRDIQKLGMTQLPPDGLVNSVDELFDYYWKQDNEEDFYRLLSRDQLLSVVNNRKALCLNDARKLAFRLGISLYDLISGNAVNVTQMLNIEDFCHFPKSFLQTSERQKRNHESVLRGLNGLSKSDSEPLSLKATARHLGVSVGYLEYRFPTQVKRITTRYKHFKQVEHLKKIYLAQRRSLEYFVSASEGVAPKSRKQAYRQLKEETGLPKWMLKKAIQTAFDALF